MSKKILFVIDMQNDFIDGSLGSEEAKKIVPNVVKLIESFDQDQMIWYTQDTHFENDVSFHNYKDTLEGKMLPIQHCIYKTQGWEINDDIQKTIRNHKNFYGLVKGFQKRTFGCINMIKEASLYLWENPKSEDEIHICGLCTDICVISNALLLRAQFPNLHIYCYENCCAGTSKEAHDAAMLIMKMNQIEVCNFN